MKCFDLVSLSSVYYPISTTKYEDNGTYSVFLSFQACIDDNLDMVQFLVERKADIDACDNEGWTALHATTSCGFLEIAK